MPGGVNLVVYRCRGLGFGIVDDIGHIAVTTIKPYVSRGGIVTQRTHARVSVQGQLGIGIGVNIHHHKGGIFHMVSSGCDRKGQCSGHGAAEGENTAFFDDKIIKSNGGKSGGGHGQSSVLGQFQGFVPSKQIAGVEIVSPNMESIGAASWRICGQHRIGGGGDKGQRRAIRNDFYIHALVWCGFLGYDIAKHVGNGGVAYTPFIIIANGT